MVAVREALTVLTNVGGLIAELAYLIVVARKCYVVGSDVQRHSRVNLPLLPSLSAVVQARRPLHSYASLDARGQTGHPRVVVSAIRLLPTFVVGVSTHLLHGCPLQVHVAFLGSRLI